MMLFNLSSSTDREVSVSSSSFFTVYRPVIEISLVMHVFLDLLALKKWELIFSRLCATSLHFDIVSIDMRLKCMLKACQHIQIIYQH